MYTHVRNKAMKKEERKETTQPGAQGKRPESPTKNKQKNKTITANQNQHTAKKHYNPYKTHKKGKVRRKDKEGERYTQPKLTQLKVKQPWENKKTKTEKREKS